MGLLGKAVLRLHDRWQSWRNTLFSRLAAGGFGSCGKRSHIALPVRLLHPELMHLGSRVYVGPGSWLQALQEQATPGTTPRIDIGDDCAFAGYDVISAAERIVIEPGVLFARNVYVSDHVHAFEDHDRAIQFQGVAKVAPVVIEAGAWLGQNVVVCPGVRIGRGAVIGANSLVRSDVPARHLAAGNPAKVLREL